MCSVIKLYKMHSHVVELMNALSAPQLYNVISLIIFQKHLTSIISSVFSLLSYGRRLILYISNSYALLFKQGVDPSIRAEVWEFLLGCYALSSTAEHRKQLRMARRFYFGFQLYIRTSLVGYCTCSCFFC